MVRRILAAAWLIVVVILVPVVARAANAELVAELHGARAGDVVCVVTDIPRFPDEAKNASDKALAKALLPLLVNHALVRPFVEALTKQERATNPGVEITKPYDDASDWSWQKLELDKLPARSYVACLRDGNVVPSWEAHVLVIDLEVKSAKTGQRIDLIRGAVTLSGTSLRIELKPRVDFAPGPTDHEVTFHIIGGSYRPESGVTTGQRVTLNLQTRLTSFSRRLPESAAMWSNATVTSHGNPTKQARIHPTSGVLEGVESTDTELVIDTTTPTRTMTVRHRGGAEELEVLKASVSWSAPSSVGPLGREALACPGLTLPDQGTVTCPLDVPAANVKREQCVYTCTSPGGFTLPTRMRFQAGTIEWEDTLAWGRFESKSFASPAPSLVLFPRFSSERERRTYVVIGDDAGRGISYPLDCPPRPKEGDPPPSPTCRRWTTRIARNREDDLAYQHFGGGRFIQQRASEDQGAYTLKPPDPKSVYFSARAGVTSKFRGTDGVKPSVGGELALEMQIPVAERFLGVVGLAWRYGPRSIDVGVDTNSIATSGITPSLGVLHCLHCAGATSVLDWLGVEAGLALTYPFANADQYKTGTWFADFEASAVYRIVFRDDGWWGGSAALGAARDTRFVADTADTQSNWAARVALSLWAYLY